MLVHTSTRAITCWSLLRVGLTLLLHDMCLATLGRWGVLTIHFRSEEYIFRQSRGLDDVKLVEKVSNTSSFGTIGQAQVSGVVMLSSFVTCVARDARLTLLARC